VLTRSAPHPAGGSWAALNCCARQRRLFSHTFAHSRPWDCRWPSADSGRWPGSELLRCLELPATAPPDPNESDIVPALAGGW